VRSLLSVGGSENEPVAFRPGGSQKTIAEAGEAAFAAGAVKMGTGQARAKPSSYVAEKDVLMIFIIISFPMMLLVLAVAAVFFPTRASAEKLSIPGQRRSAWAS
jgi:hypothetical protein